MPILAQGMEIAFIIIVQSGFLPAKAFSPGGTITCIQIVYQNVTAN